MKINTIAKNQHYIPESLLSNFTTPDGKLFEALLESKNIYLTNPSNSMSKKFAYEDDSLEVNTIENYFGRIESEVVPAIKRLVDLINNYKLGSVSIKVIKAEVENLLPIFIVFYYRSGALLTEFSSMDEKHTIPALSRKILDHEYINRLAHTVKDFYKFAIVESSSDFLLSDQFVSTTALKIKSRFFDVSNRHIGLVETMILIPISSSYYISYWHSTDLFPLKEGTINTLDEQQILSFNETIINNSYTKCVAAKKERIEQAISTYKFSSPTQIFTGGNPSGFFAGAIKKKEVFFFEEDKQVHELLEFMRFTIYEGLKVNDKCACNSGKKYKRCHKNAYDKLKIIMQGFGRTGREKDEGYQIPGVTTVERPVDNWSGYSDEKI